MKQTTISKELILDKAKECFIYDTPNPGQLEAIVFIIDQIVNKQKKHVIVQAPTGIGKSVISHTVYQVLSSLLNYKQTIITASKGLQDQLVGEFKTLTNMMGRSNYPCSYDAGHYGTSDCFMYRYNRICNPERDCSYFKKREEWLSSRYRCTNMSYQIEVGPETFDKLRYRHDVMVIDECHDLESALLNHAVIELKLDEILVHNDLLKHFDEGINKDIKESFDALINKISYPQDTYFEVDSNILDSIQSFISLLYDMSESMEKTLFDSNISGRKALYEYSMVIKGYTKKLELFILNKDNNNIWIVNKQLKDKGYIQLKAVYAHLVSNFAIFCKADYIIHMSATICGEKEYAEALGLKKEDYAFIDLPNPIPLESRMVYVYPKFRINKDFSDWGEYIKSIDFLIDGHLPENGIIHTVSFALAERIKNGSNYTDKMIISNNREEILSLLSNYNDSKIILSPSIEKGYDFKGDMARWQILAKVPYLSLGDPLIKLNSSLRPKWYGRQAILRMVQSSGRCVRGVNDHASTYIIDQCFIDVFKRNKSLFPQWYIDSINILDV